MFSSGSITGGQGSRDGSAGEGLRILVIDENPRDRSLIGEALRNGLAGAETIDVVDPADASRVLATERYDAVVTDHRPGRLDAFAVLGHVREGWPNVPLVLCTGEGSEGLAAAAIKAGFSDYVPKGPGSLPRLVSAIRSALDEVARRRIERDAGELYRSLFEGVPVGLLRATPTGQILDANPALVRMLGYPSREGLMAVNLRQLYRDPGDRETLRKRLEAEGEVRDLEVCWRRYAGQLIWLRQDIRAVRDAQGRLLHYEGVLEDITERKRFREEMLESNQFREEIISGAGEGIIVYDRDLRHLVWNRFMESLLGLPAERVLGRRALDVFPRLADHGVDRLLQRALSGETVSTSDIPCGALETGRPGWIVATYGPHRGAEGRIVGVIGIVHDVTERRIAEQALRESEERFRNMADAAPVMIWVDDAEGLTTYFSKPWLDFTGRTFEEERGRGSRNDIHPEDLPRFETAYGSALATRKAFQTEYRLRRADGEYRWILETATPRFTASGEFSGFLGSAIDITDRRAAEQALRESEERFRRMADASPVLIWMDDAEGLCTYFNKSWLDFTGRTLEQELGHGWWETVHPDDLARFRTEYEEAQAAHRRFQTEYRVRRADGQYRWLIDTGAPRFTASGAFDGYIGSSIDITARRRAEDALKESEARYRTQVEHAPEAIVVFDVDAGRFMEANDNALNLWGLSRRALLQANPADLSPPFQPDGRASAEAIRGNIARTLEGDAPIFEWVHRDAAGRDIPCEVRLVRLPSASRLLIRGSVTDISERKRAEKVQSALYRIAATTSSAEDIDEFYAAIHGIVGELMYAKNFYVALHDPMADIISFPYCVDEVDPAPEPMRPGRSLTAYVLRTGEPLLAREEEFDELVRRGKVELVGSSSVAWLGVPLTRGVRAFGVLVVQSYDPRFRFDEADREVLTFVSQHIAVALERKNAQEAIRESEERYRLLFERNLAGVYRMTLAGRILECNDAMARIFGYPARRELLDRDIRTLFPATSGHAEFLEALLQFRNLTNYELCGQHRDGHPVWTLGNASLLADETAGEIIVEGTVTDITDRRILEDQLRQSQKLEAIGQLAGGVAHDFNNLLTSVLGYSDIALRQLAEGDPIRAEILEIRKAGERAANLTRQLLAFSRKQVFEPRVLDLNALIAESGRMLGRLIGEHIRLATELDASLGSVRADPGQIEQVIVNLVVNARDAMPDGGTLTIRTRNAEVEPGSGRDHYGMDPGSYVVIAVEDTGSGIDPEIQKRIFEPFFTTKEKPLGTGLGLATVYGIVSQSGGRIFVSSKPGRGATFSVYLPRVELSAAAAAEPAEREVRPGSETILLVEDEEALRNLTRRCLEANGYTVLPAADAEAALDLASRHPGRLHLLVTDVIMPGASGPELSRQLLARRPDVRVLFVSGYTDAAIASHGVLENGAAFLQKPFTPDTLARKVRDVLDAGARAPEPRVL
jgi:two-component system cell cycle sensor histidine kinase/response regulator CckA